MLTYSLASKLSPNVDDTANEVGAIDDPGGASRATLNPS